MKNLLLLIFCASFSFGFAQDDYVTLSDQAQEALAPHIESIAVTGEKTFKGVWVQLGDSAYSVIETRFLEGYDPEPIHCPLGYAESDSLPERILERGKSTGLDVALSLHGEREVIGGDNLRITLMFTVAHYMTGAPKLEYDSDAWCGALLAFCEIVAENDIRPLGPRVLAARSYLEYGFQVLPENAIPGDIVVLWRESPDSWKGHVGYFLGFVGDGRQVVLLSGNVDGEIKIELFPVDRILDIRRPK